MIKPSDIVLLSPAQCSAAAVREAVGFEEIVRANPHHAVFVVWNRVWPEEPFAFVVRIHKDTIRKLGGFWSGFGGGLPIWFDEETRVATIEAALPA